MANVFVTLDVSQLSGWLKVYAYCRERKQCTADDAGRAAGREAGGGGRPRCTQRAGESARLQVLGGRAAASREHSLRAERWERTMNMLCMVVTLEVSQLEMSALK